MLLRLSQTLGGVGGLQGGGGRRVKHVCPAAHVAAGHVAVCWQQQQQGRGEWALHGLLLVWLLHQTELMPLVLLTMVNLGLMVMQGRPLSSLVLLLPVSLLLTPGFLLLSLLPEPLLHASPLLTLLMVHSWVMLQLSLC